MSHRPDRTHPLLTRDPVDGTELVVTRLEGARTGVVIEGRFSLGWLGRLRIDQIELVGQLLARRNSLQKLAAELDVSYAMLRTRFDEIVAAVGGDPSSDLADADDEAARIAALQALAAGDADFDQTLKTLRG